MEDPCPAPPPKPAPGFLARFGDGLRIALGLILFFPFLLFLAPIWYIHRWNEIRQGRPPPPPPWEDEEAWYARQYSIKKPPAPPASEPLFISLESMDSKEKPTAIPTPPANQEGVALITGGGQRLGAFLTRELANSGYAVAVGYHQSAIQATQLVAELTALGRQAIAIPMDLSNPKDSERALEEVTARLGPLTLLINNAGLFLPTTMNATWDEMEAMLMANLQGPIWLSLKAARIMESGQGGQIINIADIWGLRPLKGHTAYSASKAGLIMATRTMARDLAPMIRVNAIAPGAVLPPDNKNPRFERLMDQTPLGSEASPTAVWHAVRYLMSARFVTGEVLHVDGGRSGEY